MKLNTLIRVMAVTIAILALAVPAAAAATIQIGVRSEILARAPRNDLIIEGVSDHSNDTEEEEDDIQHPDPCDGGDHRNPGPCGTRGCGRNNPDWSVTR